MKTVKEAGKTPWAGVITAASMIALFGAGLSVSACNPQTVEFQTSSGAISKTIVTPIGGQVPMDILWVVDNSFSMCEEQEVLRDNFSSFVEVLAETNLDFHIALTTTHAPESSTGIIEPIAQEAYLQSTPQPVPGNNQACLRGAGEGTMFKPLREALEVAKGCLADPEEASQYDWTEAQIECALQSDMKQQMSGCVAATALKDVRGQGGIPDNLVDVFDLFPDVGSYRAIPKVLRAADYEMGATGKLDTARLTKDFSCMATVGTRGDSYEKGLRAAVRAVGPMLTGGAVEIETANMSSPNHGFIRKDAGFALIFVTDENDCSHNGEMKEIGNQCGSDICEYENSSALAEGESKLVKVEELADELRANLAATKQLSGPEALLEDQLLIASINGTSKRYDEPYPSCLTAETRPDVEAACQSALGSAFSGDRYERFMRQFKNFYPNSVLDDAEDPEVARLDFSRYEPLGWMCTDTFAPALTAIAEFITRPSGGCLAERVFACESDTDCPQKLFAGEAGTCREFPGGAPGERFCDSGVVLKLERNPTVEALTDDINAISYCLPESINQLDSANPSCVVAPSAYTLDPCASGRGVQFNWVDPPEQVANALSGYTLETIYNITPE